MLCGEACEAVVLQRVDADSSCVMLLGSSHRTEVSLWGADPHGMTMAMHGALEQAATVPHQVKLVHAMGSSTSDNAEVAAVLKPLAAAHPQDSPLVVMGHKANIGHSVEAAGVIAMIVTVLALQHRKSSCLINVHELSRKLRLTTRILIPAHALVLLTGRGMTSASISGTSVSGDNVNLLLAKAAPDEYQRAQLLPQHRAQDGEVGTCLLGLEMVLIQMVVHKQTWPSATCNYLAHHRVGYTPMVPGTCYLCMAREAL